MKSITRMNDEELIRYIEGQSLILNEFGMKTEFHIDEWLESKVVYDIVECPWCDEHGQIAAPKHNPKYDPQDPDMFLLFDYNEMRMCPYCDGTKEYEIEDDELVRWREVSECTNFIDETIYSVNQSII